MGQNDVLLRKLTIGLYFAVIFFSFYMANPAVAEQHCHTFQLQNVSTDWPTGIDVMNCKVSFFFTTDCKGVANDGCKWDWTEYGFTGVSTSRTRCQNVSGTSSTTPAPVAHWVTTSSPPNNAIVGGHIEDTPHAVYICRANHNSNIHPGKAAFYDGRWSCFIGNGGREERYEKYEMFVGNSAEYKWSATVKNALPSNAVQGGHISDTPHPVYICRAYHNGNAHPGKLAFYDERWSCFIGNGGGEQRYEAYEVLLKN